MFSWRENGYHGFHRILKELNLTEGTELYRLAWLLLEYNKNNINKEKQDAALKYFFELTEKDAHDTIIDEYSPVVGNKRTPLVLLIQLQMDKIVGDQAEILKAIKQHLMHIKLLDARALLMAINYFFDAPNEKRWFFNELFYVPTCNEPPLDTLEIGYQQKIFNVLKECLIQNRSARIDLLKKIIHAMAKDYHFETVRTLVNLLLDSQPNDLDEVIPLFTFEKKAFTFNEWVIEKDNVHYLEMIFPRINLNLRWKLFLFAIHSNKQSCVEAFMKDPEVMEKFKQEGQLLLTDLLDVGDDWQTSNNRSYLATKNVELFLDAGAIYDKKLEMRKYNASGSKIIIRAVEFFNSLNTKTLTLTECVKILINFKNKNELLPLNARDIQGDTVFCILSKTVMEASDAYFEELLYFIMIENVNLQLKNNAGKTIYDLECFNAEQKMLMSIAENIAFAQKLHTKQTEDKFQSESIFVKQTQKILEALMPLPLGNISCAMYFEILKLYLSCKDSFEDIGYGQYMEHLRRLLQNKSKFHLWKAINDVLEYPETGIQEERKAVLSLLLKKLKSESEALSLTQEQLADQNIDHPYKYAFSLGNGKKFETIQLLLENDIPFDVVVDETSKNSLMHEMMRVNKHDFVHRMLSKVDLCPKFLSAVNREGDTLLHCAIKSGIPIQTFQILVDALILKAYDLDQENAVGLSPFYVALMQNKTLLYAMKLFKTSKVSLVRTEQKTQFTASDFWYGRILDFPGNIQRKEDLWDEQDEEVPVEDQIRKFLQFGWKMFCAGACMPRCEQEFKLSIQQLKFAAEQELELSEDIFKSFNDDTNKLFVAWELIEKIERDTEVSYKDFLSVFPCLMTTHRFSDKKTMWEVLFTKKLNLQKELEILEENRKEDKTAAIDKAKKRTLFVDQLLSILILYGINPGNTNETYKQLFNIFQESQKLPQYIKIYSDSKFTKPGVQIVVESKEEQETKVVAESLQAQATPEEQLLDCGRELLKRLEDIQGIYDIFVTRLAFVLATELFRVDEKGNKLSSNQMLIMAQDFIVKAEQCSNSPTLCDTSWRHEITQLNAKISAYSPVHCPYTSMQNCLKILMPTTKLQSVMPHISQSMYDIINSHGVHATLSCIAEQDDHGDLCALIPAAFKRADEAIASLNFQLEALKKQQKALEAENRRLTALLPEPSKEKEARKAEIQEVADAPATGKRPKRG